MLFKNIFSKTQKEEITIDDEPVLWVPPVKNGAKAADKKTRDHLFNLPIKPAAFPGRGRVIMLQSPEGGAGATTVATNLAALLARGRPEKVVLVDLDGFGAVRGRMGFPPGQCSTNLLDWLDLKYTSEINGAMVAHSSGVMVVPGVVHYDHLAWVTSELIFNVISILKERFEDIVLDCAPVGQKYNSWAAALVSDLIITMIKPSRTSLDLLPDNLSYLNRLGCADRNLVILNQAGLPGAIKHKEIIKDHGIQMDYVLPYSTNVEEAANKRELIVTSRPRDVFVKELKNIKIDQQIESISDSGNLDEILIKNLAVLCKSYVPLDLEEEEITAEFDSDRVAGLRQEEYRRVRVYTQNELRRQFQPEELKGTRDKTVRAKLRAIIARALVTYDLPLGQSAVEELVEELGNDCLGYGPIEPYFHDPDVTEIRATADTVMVERGGKLEVMPGITFREESHMRDILDRMLAPTGRSISPNTPRVDATLHDGSRLKAHIPPVSPRGTMFSIRRFKQDMTIEKMIAIGAMSQSVADFLKAAVLAKQNIIVSGGTSTGKTTILNCIASFIPPEESVITIEDPPELQLQHPDVRSLEARPANNEGKGCITMRELVQDALRMAPKRIIVGECRGGEAFEMLQAMNTGHEGSLTTGHANSAWLMTKRLISLIQMADMGQPYEAIVEQITYLDLIIQVVREKGGARRVDHICEINGVKRKEEGVLEVDLNVLWQYNRESSSFEWVAKNFAREDKLIEDGGWDNRELYNSGTGANSAGSTIAVVRQQAP